VKYRFLLAQLYMDSLTDAETIESLQTRLKKLPSTIDEHYDSIIKRIIDGSQESAALAKGILMLTTFAARPLTSLQNTLATRSGDPGLVKTRVPPQHRLVEVCAGLVVIEKGTDNLKLVHESTMA
jgi:hypothetical protein